MTVGLPGSGIGGVFYLLSALCMPVVAAVRWFRSQDGAWGMVFRQLSLAVGVIVGLAVTAWLLGIALARTPMTAWVARGALDAGRIPTVLRTGAVAVSLVILGLVIVTVWICAFVVHGRAAFWPKVDPADRADASTNVALVRASSDR
jgi:hypothetical protein